MIEMLFQYYMFIIGDVDGGETSLSTITAFSCLLLTTSSFSWRDVLLLISISSFLIVSTWELHNVDDLGRLISILRLPVASFRGDWLNRLSKWKTCFEGVASFTWKGDPKRTLIILFYNHLEVVDTTSALFVEGVPTVSSLFFLFRSWSNELVNERLAFWNMAPDPRSKYWLRNSLLYKKMSNGK